MLMPLGKLEKKGEGGRGVCENALSIPLGIIILLKLFKLSCFLWPNELIHR